MVHFRKRFGLANISAINDLILNIEKEDRDDDNEPKNKGNLLIYVTCAPADIRYPIDLSLLNEAREKTEKIIDTLYFPLNGTIKKPRPLPGKIMLEFVPDKALHSEQLTLAGDLQYPDIDDHYNCRYEDDYSQQPAEEL